jgi:hypothetical protein
VVCAPIAPASDWSRAVRPVNLALDVGASLHALERAGNSMDARIAMIAITTNSSIKVKPHWVLFAENNSLSWKSFMAAARFENS